MKKIMKNCVFVCLIHLICSVHIFCQGELKESSAIDQLVSHYESANEALKSISTAISPNRKKHILYVNPSWSNCLIIKHDGSIHACSGRYSVLDNAIEILVDGLSRMIRPGRIAGAIVDGRIYESISSKRFPEETQSAFLEVLEYGRAHLYVRHVLRSRMRGSNALTLDVTGEKVYYMKEEFVYALNSGEIKSIPSKKGFVKALKEKGIEPSSSFNDIKWKKGSKEDLKIAFANINEGMGEDG